MQPEQDIPGRTLRALKFRPKGMTITEIAKALKANRNSVSKHLEVMQAIPTTFESGEKGCTIVLDDITERKQYIRNTMFLARTEIELVDLPPVNDICQYRCRGCLSSRAESSRALPWRPSRGREVTSRQTHPILTAPGDGADG